MSHAAAATSIRERLDTLWSTTAIAWPNTNYVPTNGTAWVRPSIRFDSASQTTLGQTGRKRVLGALDVEIFIPSNTPTGTAWTYADTLGGHFQRVTINGLVFRDYNAEVAELPEGEPWHRLMLEVPFYYDDDVSEASEVAVYGNQVVSQAAHGLAVGDWIKCVSGTYSKARANSEANLSWPGVVVEVPSADVFRFVSLGKANLPSHGLGAAGTKVFLSQATEGADTATEPSSGLAQQLAKVIDADHVDVQTWPVVNKG